MIKLFILAGACVLLASCKQNKPATENADIQYKGDTIVVSENSPVLKDMAAASAQLQDFSAEFRTVGTVRPVTGKLAGIAPPFAGRIVKSFIQLGQKVNAGSPVFELGSSEFYEATKAYFTAQSASELAQQNYNRQKELTANGVAAQRDSEQAKSEAHIANQEFEQAKATLQLFNTDAASLQMGQPLKVLSPIAGEVVKSNITIGNYIGEDSEPLVIVADLSRVWVAALVKETFFGAINPGDRVEIFTNAHPNKVIWGMIHYIGEMLDEETRSLEVIVECNNADKELKLGMFCEVHFLSSPTKAIILPSTAIMQEQDNDYVLIELSKGNYIRRKVETESVHQDSVRVVSGISEGEKVVIKGGIYLNR
ncbi:MAG: efflux RND transporter periplasmic adaptor subunit [Tannerellaceae bacterium]|jgi:cobalt-zinc-cadmium efflux system membrane fusion protein|nr:efflux RND transporter periplasmic adaptor subunit [Tannerellaceae bacterium]